MAVVLFFVIHWYASLFFQSFFQHRYAAHRICTMSKGWEKFFFVCCWITQGSSYISAYAYGILHRLHHVHTDTMEDPHTPVKSKNPFMLMWHTKLTYGEVWQEKIEIDDKYKKQLPEWHSFDKFAHHGLSRLVFVAIYSTFWATFATEWWHWIFLPMTIAIGSFQGAMINYFSHKIGYRNYEVNNTSTNLIPFFDIFFWGEAYHNNHHKYAGKANHAHRWFEWDPLYFVMTIMDFLGIIKLKKKFNTEKVAVF